MYVKNGTAYGINEFKASKWVETTPTPTPVFSYEAEDATITGHAGISYSAVCSGTSKVNGIVGVAAVEFSVDVPTTAPYLMSVDYLEVTMQEENGAQLDAYEIKYYITGQEPAYAITSSPTYTLTNLLHGQTYNISVRAAQSIWSSETTATITDVPNYQAWNSTTSYAVDTLVLHENKVWRAKVANQAKEPALTNAWDIDKEIVKVITSSSIYDQIKASLDQYELDVEANFDADIEILYGTFDNAEKLRTYIKGIYANSLLSGVILVGNLPAHRHQKIFGTGEKKQFSLPLYFMDLDNEFTDKDDDGYTDTHPWEGDENTLKIESEIWVSIIQPAANNAIPELNAFFQKTHTYYVNQTQYPKRALVAGQATDYSGNVNENHAYYTNLNYFTNIDKLGGYENGQHIYVYKEDYLNQLKTNTYLLNDVSTHASQNGQAFCDPPPANNMLYAGRLKEIPAGYGALITLIWGCNAGDYGAESTNNTALRYVLADHIGQVSVANARSIGIETPEEMVTNMIDENITFAQAFYQWHLAKMNPVKVRECFSAAQEPILAEYVWANCLFGNPFIKIPQ